MGGQTGGQQTTWGTMAYQGHPLKSPLSKPLSGEESLKTHRIKIDDFDKSTTKLNADAVNLENVTEFSQRDMAIFVDIETTDDEKHALSTRCLLPRKQHMFPDVVQCKTKRYFRS